MTKPEIIIFTDGASKGNPGLGGWGSVVAIYDSKDEDFKNQALIFELGGSEINTTNNRMELAALIGSLEYLKHHEPLILNRAQIIIYSDSNYAINGITKWVKGWQKRGWQTTQKEEVLNRDLWERLITATAGLTIDWRYVGGHVGVAGNERADELASALANGHTPDFFSGPALHYGRDIFNINFDTTLESAKQASRSHSRSRAYSYVSKVGGKVKLHKTWFECERAVKGKPGALYKKALSKEDESALLKAWGK